MSKTGYGRVLETDGDEEDDIELIEHGASNPTGQLRANDAGAMQQLTTSSEKSGCSRYYIVAVILAVAGGLFVAMTYMTEKGSTVGYDDNDDGSMMSSIPPAPDQTLNVVTWNIAAVNNNPFEYWITMDSDPRYDLLMESVSNFIENPAPGDDVTVSEVFTPSMFEELFSRMESVGWGGDAAGQSALAATRYYWENDYKYRKIVSEFLKDDTLGKKRLISMPDRITNTIHSFPADYSPTDSGISVEDAEEISVMRPSVINCYEAPPSNDPSSPHTKTSMSTVIDWWPLWLTYMFEQEIRTPVEVSQAPVGQGRKLRPRRQQKRTSAHPSPRESNMREHALDSSSNFYYWYDYSGYYYPGPYYYTGGKGKGGGKGDDKGDDKWEDDNNDDIYYYYYDDDGDNDYGDYVDGDNDDGDNDIDNSYAPPLIGDDANDENEDLSAPIIVDGIEIKKVYQMLPLISRAKYPDITAEEAAASIPLETLCLAIFDAILVHILNNPLTVNVPVGGESEAFEVTPVADIWQPIRAEICDKLNLKKMDRTAEILEHTYHSADVLFLQEAPGNLKQVLERMQQLRGSDKTEQGLSDRYEVVATQSMDSERDQNSYILLRKALFEGASIQEVTDDVVAAYKTAHAGESLPIVSGDLVVITAKVITEVVVPDAMVKTTGDALAGASGLHGEGSSTNLRQEGGGRDNQMEEENRNAAHPDASSKYWYTTTYLLASFHGDTNGYATKPVVKAVQEYASSLRSSLSSSSSAQSSSSKTTDSTDSADRVVLLFGLDANTYSSPNEDEQGVVDFSQFFTAPDMGLNSCWGPTPDPQGFTTFNARTHLQTQLNKAVSLENKDAEGDKNLKDFILFFDSDVQVQSVLKDNTGSGSFTEGMVFPTLNFPSDHGVVSASLLVHDEQE